MPPILRRENWEAVDAPSLRFKQHCYAAGMPRILVVADTSWVINEVESVLSLPGFELITHSDPRTLVPAIVEHRPDVAIVDLQVGTMGGMAMTRAIKEAAQGGGSPDVPVVLLLDRLADGFLAKRAAVHSWLVKPFEPHQLREAVGAAVGSEETLPQP